MPLWQEAFSAAPTPAAPSTALPSAPAATAPAGATAPAAATATPAAPAVSATPAPPVTSAPPAAPQAPAVPEGTGVPAGMRTFAGLRVPPGHGASVSLTFDDGPAPAYTTKVLALLASHRVTAVFCLVGTQVAAHPQLVRAEHAAGHLLCDHSRDHDLTMTTKGAAYVTAEVDDGIAAVRRAAPGVPVPYYRQPGGEWTPEVLSAASAAGLRPLRWSVDPRDWSRPGERAIASRVLEQLRPGGVVLMHDGGGDRSETVAVLTWLLDALPQAGWHFTLPAA
ncbi:peptidoglycan/xylan/chitin deacetylase (PgdA/CDA1 family) [Motilibacter peucedani]|uniref:Peptidoglycan/xylan/chitin deacetylase (PgdA/CDA1 family) n=1 Tax=Motilibacter peucedani TaxID=598650 RepID=A0A420XR00_9ACTN|nr:peptidoglycan/xylan/chitin deacetylase (PgdA/CDA1 family) [Motilibacter peucedani]